MNSKYLDEDLFNRVELVAKKKVKNEELRMNYIDKMYEELGGRFAEEESDSEAELEAIVENIKESDSDSDIDTEVELPHESPKNAPDSPAHSSDVQVGELKVSDDEAFRWMVQVGDTNIHFGQSDQPIIWELNGSINRIKNRYMKQLDKERSENPTCNEFWELNMLWTKTQDTIEAQFEIAKDCAEMRLYTIML